MTSSQQLASLQDANDSIISHDTFGAKGLKKYFSSLFIFNTDPPLNVNPAAKAHSTSSPETKFTLEFFFIKLCVQLSVSYLLALTAYHLLSELTLLLVYFCLYL